MGCVGKEIVQSRVWIDPSAPAPPNLNYKETYPITVFEAVIQSMDSDSKNLKEILDNIYNELGMRQMRIPGKSANYLMTYAGTAGAVGAIQMSREIPWDSEKQSHDRIPTEKAIGDFIQKLGLVDEDGNLVDPGDVKVRWSDIIGRPLIYDDLGDNEDGFMTQKAVTKNINALKLQIGDMYDGTIGRVNDAINALTDHSNNKNNPHNVTIAQLGAVSAEAFLEHTTSTNPHNITPALIGLGNVNNTSDLDKPISNATQEALDAINKMIRDLIDDSGQLNFVDNITYDQPSGILKVTYRNGSFISINIPIDGLIDDIKYDKDRKELVVYELSGNVSRVDVSDLFIRYIGSVSSNITVEIDGTNESGNQIIKATINNQSITEAEMADGSVITRILANQSVTTDKIYDLSITTIKLSDGSVTTEKVSKHAITNTKLADRSVDGRVLFTSAMNSRVLIVNEHGTDPMWGLVIGDMIDINAIDSRHILKAAVTSDKIAENSVITSKITDGAITNEKIADFAITYQKLGKRSVDRDNIVSSIVLEGTPSIGERPSDDSIGSEIPDTRWVVDRIRSYVNNNLNYGDRSVDGRVLFTSDTRHRALVVLRAGSDPVWGQIDHEMMATDSIDTDNIMNLAVTADKIKDDSILQRHLTNDIIGTEHIQDNAITSEKIFLSDNANMVLAALNEKSHPVYSKVTGSMIEQNAIIGTHIQDHSILLSKLELCEEPHRILGVTLSGTNPEWTKVTSEMIGDRVVLGKHIFTTPYQDMILGVNVANSEPMWMKIKSEMLQDKLIKRDHISDGAIWAEHLQEKIIESRHILDRTIQSHNIAPKAITGIELFTSPLPNRVLAVTSMPYSNPEWLQVTTDMIEDLAITKEKIFQSEYPYRVLGATQAGVPPEYLMITHQFIVDGTITPAKLQRNFVLYGTPELTLPPHADADNHQIANTAWVRKTVANMINDFNPEILFDTVTNEMLGDHIIDGTKLFTHPYGPRVLGITAANGDVEFILIEEDLIVDGAVTTNKLQRDIHLLGSPIVEIRPSAYASDANGGGDLIPDCQWVLDRIKEAGLGGSGGTSSVSDGMVELTVPEVEDIWEDGTIPADADDDTADSGISQISEDQTTSMWEDGTMPDESGSEQIQREEISVAELLAMWEDGTMPEETPDEETSTEGTTGTSGSYIPNGSIETVKLMDRSVTARKLFTSTVANRILGVLEANSDPQYVRLINEMIEDRVVDGRVLFTSNIDNVILSVGASGSDPAWTKINHEMLEKDIIDSDQLVNYCVTNEKLANRIITREKIADQPFVDSLLLMDNSVTTQKIVDDAVDNSKIKDKSVNSKKLDTDLVLTGHPTVEPDTSLETRSIRNTVISPNKPKGGCSGDIWFRYT